MDDEVFPVPAELAAAVDRSDDPALRSWLVDLPQRVADLAERWALQLNSPFQPGGSSSWVAPARDAHGRDAVLKVAWTHIEARDEAEGLAAWAGQGAVEVFASAHDGDTTALLLEHCRPGRELRSRPQTEQHQVIADLLHRLHRVSLPSGHRFRPLTQMCDEWATSAAAGHARHPHLLDPGLVREGLALWRELPRTSAEEVLLCTDLHAGNVLSGQRSPWLVIDPKPYVGDPHYDVLQHLLNCQDALQADPVALVRQVADAAGLDAARVQQWLLARCVQNSWDWPALAPVAKRLAPSRLL